MIPAIVYETLASDSFLASECGITSDRILELQSVDERPFDNGVFIIVNWQESYPTAFAGSSASVNSPRTLLVWVHQPWDRGRDFRTLDKVLNRIDQLLLPMEQQTGTDGIRLACITKQGRSGNLTDDGWKTISRNATYRVLYDESMA